ncbi:MAG: hypothetical protein IPO93_12020 [Actinobacteria bacterium]|nr:hypothetical protein [Actinomycetota bacterium]
MTSKALVGLLAAALIIVSAVLVAVLVSRPSAPSPVEPAGASAISFGPANDPDCERVARMVRGADVLRRAWAEPAPTAGTDSTSPQLERMRQAYVEGAARLWPDTTDPALRSLLKTMAEGSVTNAAVAELHARCDIDP